MQQAGGIAHGAGGHDGPEHFDLTQIHGAEL
jgi:hypothetical protein